MFKIVTPLVLIWRSINVAYFPCKKIGKRTHKETHHQHLLHGTVEVNTHDVLQFVLEASLPQ